MTLIIAGPQDPQTLLGWIEENQRQKSFAPAKDVGRYLDEEPESVVSSHTVIPMDVAVRKVAVAYKFPALTTSAKDRVRREGQSAVFFESHFSSLNPDYQKWLDQESSMIISVMKLIWARITRMMMFYNETEDAAAFTQFIEEQSRGAEEAGYGLSAVAAVKTRYFRRGDAHVQQHGGYRGRDDPQSV